MFSTYFHPETLLLHTLLKELREMSETLQSKIDTLTADMALQDTAVAKAVELLNSISGQLSAALAAAGAAGATPAQLSALDALDTDLKARTGDLTAAVAADTPVVVAPPSA